MSFANDRLLQLREKIRDFPLVPGVYLMKSKEQKIIYIGKAKALRNRVRSYFADPSDLSPKTHFLMRSVWEIEYLITNTELEALLLEAQLIKKHRPKYNIRLKDDKSYPYIMIAFQHAFPRLYLARKVKNDGNFYFGPYPKGQVVAKTIRFLNEHFKIRDCTDGVFHTRKRPCLSYQIQRCTAPCVALVSQANYRHQIQEAQQFLLGEGEAIVAHLEKSMWDLAEQDQFERAAKLRDSIQALKLAFERQSVVKEAHSADLDIIAFKSAEQGVMFETFHIRKGVELGSRSYFFSVFDASDDGRETLLTFLTQYYEDNFIPDQVLLPMDLGADLTHLLSQLLKSRSHKNVLVRFAGDSIGSQWLAKAQASAEAHYEKAVSKNQEREQGLLEIQQKLNLPEFPNRIECFDISTFQGQETVASQVVFEQGLPAKEHYRRYKIKTVQGIDDFASMAEVLSRRFAHHEYEEPQLLVVDGGKGQLAIAVKILEQMEKAHIPVVGLAKARTRSQFASTNIEVSQERFYLPGRQNPIVFKTSSLAYQILVGARDEAHRFAVTYHRKLRENTSMESVLDEIHGIGPVLKKRILKAYPDLSQLATVPVDDLAQLPGLNRVLAELIKARLEP